MKTYKVSYTKKSGGHSWPEKILVAAENEEAACLKADGLANDIYDTCPFGNHVAEIAVDFSATEISEKEVDDIVF